MKRQKTEDFEVVRNNGVNLQTDHQPDRQSSISRQSGVRVSRQSVARLASGYFFLKEKQGKKGHDKHYLRERAVVVLSCTLVCILYSSNRRTTLLCILLARVVVLILYYRTSSIHTSYVRA